MITNAVRRRSCRIASVTVISLVFGLTVGVASSAETGRPEEDQGPTTVDVTIMVLDLDEIDTPGQNFVANVFLYYRWRDPRLAHSGSGGVTLALNNVWHPRLQILNQQRLVRTFPEIVSVAPDGEVTYRQRVWGAFSQPLVLRDFPFDRQTLSIKLVAAGYTPDEVDVVANPESKVASSLSIPDWDIVRYTASSEPLVPIENRPAIAAVTLEFEAARRQRYYVLKVIVPLILIVAMSWTVFWIDPKLSSTQISVSITSMLTLIAYRFAVGNDLPKVSYLTRLDSFILVATFQVFATLVIVVITSAFAQSDRLGRAQRIDRWCRWVFPIVFFLAAAATLFPPLEMLALVGAVPGNS